jgi:hypothetical protein
VNAHMIMPGRKAHRLPSMLGSSPCNTCTFGAKRLYAKKPCSPLERKNTVFGQGGGTKRGDAAMPSAGAWRSRGGADGPASAASHGTAWSRFRGLGHAHATLTIVNVLAGHSPAPHTARLRRTALNRACSLYPTTRTDETHARRHTLPLRRWSTPHGAGPWPPFNDRARHRGRPTSASPSTSARPNGSPSPSSHGVVTYLTRTLP